MKLIFCLTVLLLQTTACLADSITPPPRLNIFFRDLNDYAMDMLKIPNTPLFELSERANGSRNYFQISLSDTGILYMSVTRRTSVRQSKTFDPKIEKINQLRVNSTGEVWLIMSDKKRYKKAFRAGNYTLLTTEEFAKQYPIAYRKFKRRGFQKVFENVPVNTPLR
jgi:hypothetical protein